MKYKNHLTVAFETPQKDIAIAAENVVAQRTYNRLFASAERLGYDTVYACIEERIVEQGESAITLAHKMDVSGTVMYKIIRVFGFWDRFKRVSVEKAALNREMQRRRVEVMLRKGE